MAEGFEVEIAEEPVEAKDPESPPMFRCVVVGVNFHEGKACEGDEQVYDIVLQQEEGEEVFDAPWTQFHVRAFGDAQAAQFPLGSGVKVTIEPTAVDIRLMKKARFDEAMRDLEDLEESADQIRAGRIAKALATIRGFDSLVGEVLARAFYLAEEVR